MNNRLLFHIVCLVVFDLGLSMVNFALNKSAYQSTTLTWGSFNWTADKAVDGNSDGSRPETSRTCSATNNTISFKNHTWEVDIGIHITVKQIIVYGRNDTVRDQLNGVKMYLGNTSRPWNYSQEFRSDTSSDVSDIIYVFKTYSVIARFISLMRSNYILTICEVTVEGDCIHGTYGHGCNGTCGKCYKGNTSCLLSDGSCIHGCEEGWHGNMCKSECDRGKYGYNCNQTCGHCLHGNISCSSSNGICSNGCDAGWQGIDCKKGCEIGKYGYNCNETCGNCLFGNISCSKSNGTCSSGCISAWKGHDCTKQCDRGTYGYNCNETCGYCRNGNSNCSTSNGICNNGCDAGWLGDRCNKECEAGTYGFNCNEVCGYCLTGQRTCSNINGHCSDGCEAGWIGETCKSECKAGTYGQNCSERCGSCLNGNNSCSKMNGQCIDGCQTGWTGETCTVGTDSVVHDKPNAGVIVGSVLATVVVSIIAMVIIIIIVKKRRKGDNNERSTEMLKGDSHYENLAFDNSADANKVSAKSKTKNETTFSAIEEACIQRGRTNDYDKSFATENSTQVYDDYEKLRNGSGTPESAYSTIDPNFIIDRKKESMENSIKFVETLKSLESALKSVEEEICSLLIKKEKLLSCELERARATKPADKRDENDSNLSNKDKEFYTDDDYAPTLRSLEEELRILAEKRKCILERKSILLRQEHSEKAETKI